MQQIQDGLAQSEAARARLENELLKERQEHRTCQDSLTHERLRHSESERTLNCLWESHQRLGDVMAKIPCHAENMRDSSPQSFNVTELVLEVAAKSQRMRALEAQLEQAQDQHHVEIVQLRDNLEQEYHKNAENTMAYTQRIHELETTLQQRTMVNAMPERREFQKPAQRARRSRRRKATSGAPLEETVSENATGAQPKRGGEHKIKEEDA